MGALINVASIYGLIVGDPSLYGQWGVDLASYVASKHGLIGLTKHLAMTLGGTGVTVNALCPGMFPNTEQNAANATGLVAGLEARTPVKRVGNDDDLRAAIVYLWPHQARRSTRGNPWSSTAAGPSGSWPHLRRIGLPLTPSARASSPRYGTGSETVCPDRIR